MFGDLQQVRYLWDLSQASLIILSAFWIGEITLMSNNTTILVIPQMVLLIL